MKTQFINRFHNEDLQNNLGWLKRTNYTPITNQQFNHFKHTNLIWLKIAGYGCVPKDIVSKVLYGSRFDMTMPVINTVYHCFKKAKAQREFYFKTSAIMMVLLNLFLLAVLFHL